MKVVLNTNIWLSAIFWRGEASKIIELAERGSITVIVTNEIILEIADVLGREDKFSKFLDNRKRTIEDVVKTIFSIAELVNTKTKINVVKNHISDNKILEAALDGKARYIVSYDNHILSLHEFREIKILKPTDFLKMVAK
jgi:putative PIN family toxin of toxin-antitoxin system